MSTVPCRGAMQRLGVSQKLGGAILGVPSCGVYYLQGLFWRPPIWESAISFKRNRRPRWDHCFVPLYMGIYRGITG